MYYYTPVLIVGGCLSGLVSALNPACSAGVYPIIAAPFSNLAAAQSYCSQNYPLPKKTVTTTGKPITVTVATTVVSITLTAAANTLTYTQTDVSTQTDTVQSTVIVTVAAGSPGKRELANRSLSSGTGPTNTTTIVSPSNTTKTMAPTTGATTKGTGASMINSDPWQSMLSAPRAVIGQVCTCIETPETTTTGTTLITSVTATSTATNTITPTVTTTMTVTTMATVSVTAVTTSTVTACAGVNYQTDNNNCGTCGRVCRSGTSCKAGKCNLPATCPNDIDYCKDNSGNCACFNGEASFTCLLNGTPCNGNCREDGDCPAGQACTPDCGGGGRCATLCPGVLNKRSLARLSARRVSSPASRDLTAPALNHLPYKSGH